MSFLKRFLNSISKPADTQIRAGFWQTQGSRVVKTIEYVGYSPEPQILQITLACQWSSDNRPLIFMTLQFSPALDSEDGYLAVRIRDNDNDSGMCVASIAKLAKGDSLVGRMERQDVVRIVEVLAGDKFMELWLGGPDGTLLCLPLPPEPDLESKLEDAARHPSARQI